MSSTVAPSAAASAAAHAQQPTPKLTEPQSMIRTGTGDDRVASRAALIALQSARLECKATIDVQPRAATSSYATAHCPGLGWVMVASATSPASRS
jgi:hypothetical protein